jgi:hypothetical protein
MNELVSKLTTGKHPVEIVLRPEKTVDAFRAAVQRKYVHVKFTDTIGGTELGIALDPEQSESIVADVEAGRGPIHISGPLTLDYEPVTCVAVIRVPELDGEGWLIPGDSPASVA